MTRTFTVYFSEDNVRTLRAEQVRLWDDYKAREPHISRESALAMKRRLDALRLAIDALVEVVPE